MKRFLMILALGAMCTPAIGQQGQPQQPGLQANATVQQPVDEKSLGEKAAYIMGFNYYLGMENQGVDLNVDQFVTGIKKAAAGEKIGMSREDMESVMMAYQRAVEKRVREEIAAKAEANKKAGEDFLKANGTKPGVMKLDNGVQYVVMNQGTGATPTKTDQVKVHYHGTLIDGTVFDSSVKPTDGSPPEPAQFAVGGVIRGFSSALQKMKTGDKWKVFIPSDLAYGQRGPGEIGPNRMLIFELELLEVVGGAAPGTGAAPQKGAGG